MSSTASVAVEFDLGVQNAIEANRTVVNGKNSLEFGSGKHLAKLRFMQDLSRIKPQMIQKVLSSIGISEDKNADFAHVNRQAERFNRRYEASNDIDMLESFRVSMGSGFGSNPRVTENKIALPFAFGVTDPDSRSLPVKALQQQSTAQLTIFYDGTMKVYDVPTEKAQAIMRLASANSSNNARTSTISSSKIEQISKTLPSKPASKAAIENQIPRPPVAGLQIVRKLSLQRFLQKRKERSNSDVAPYTTMKPARSPSKSEKDSDEQIILSLATSGQNFKTSVNGGIDF